MKIYLILFAIGLTLSGVGYWYYKDSQARIEMLREKTAALETANKINEETIKKLEQDATEAQKRMDELQASLAESEVYISDLRKMFMEHNLTLLAEEKPGLIEKRINDATKKVFDSISSTSRGR